MKAILRSYIEDHGHEDEIVEISDEHVFYKDDPYGDTVPFSVGSNQTLLPIEDLNRQELIQAIHNT